ncbi:hypothetical protein GLOTRDRAFT_94629 [Gloeophyllum trabeum ATCC 11539]|uniref:Uncharacterized protein n=1 Tax=Gloeophyllum trabeum (strain ATCC 11539 / FP-39264 / Madison 617) TaxID=670483 RepID=S7Q4C2_GLOTA|nr:uncharacterized protein GLOTRDRAFT_94629 [Gloeophyllum trabeum ATCC 11539]EPQ54328.1 hypothetical protein GLOTRDRAFT_94629 [Gloeophyllum trabeum ATCC 11539]
MSCTVCRLPFVPGPASANPRPIPPGILNERQYRYFAYGLGIGYQIIGVVNPVEYLEHKLDSNMFAVRAGLPLLDMIQWESHGGTVSPSHKYPRETTAKQSKFVICHTVCGALLRRTTHAEEDSVDSLTDLVELERILGRPQAGSQAGRFRHVKYEDVRCGKLKRVDLTPFWLDGNEEGGNTFDFQSLKASNLGFILNRPDTFPKFHETVNPDRLRSLDNATVTKDVITNLPTDVLESLVIRMETPAYVQFASSCRLLRRHAVTAWQRHARSRVLELGWAVPLSSEYEQGKKQGIVMANAKESPADADWLLYLSHVHRTQSMNVREWIWGLCQEIKRARDALRPDSEVAEIVVDGERRKSPSRLGLEKQVGPMSSMFQQIKQAQNMAKQR